mgnify:CR=1 FL=1
MAHALRLPPVRMIWPLPALLAWGAAWGLFLGLVRLAGAPVGVAVVLATALGGCAALLGGTRWRRVFIALGFPVSLLASGLAAGVPGWVWLVPLAAVFALYPVHAWRDAPVFPTPVGALAGLAGKAPLPAGACVVDAGCGLGDGLRELHAQYPAAVLHGWEWSWPLALACRWRCRRLGIPARVARRDIWSADWSAHDLVYVFQRPESMARAHAKATAELRAGAWLASLEFSVPGVDADAVLTGPDDRPVWLYRMPGR